MNKTISRSSSNRRNGRLAIIILVFVIVLIFFPYNILNGKGLLGFFLNTNEYDKLGQFISGITSPITIILVYLTYRSQKEELQASKTILEKQSLTLEKQQFESKLFSLLNIYNEIMKSFSKEDSGKTFFMKTKEGLQKNYESYPYPEYSEFVKEPSGYRHYKTYYNNNKDSLAHYLRVLYRIFSFIDSYPINILNEKEKWFYTKTVRSQLSEGELFILFYNAFTDYGENFKLLIERYNLLKHLPLTDKLEVEKFYRKSFTAKMEVIKSIGYEEEAFPNYDKKIISEAMKELLRVCNAVVDQTLDAKEEILQQVFYEKILEYRVIGNYENNVLTIKLVTDTVGTNHSLYFYTRFGFDPNIYMLKFVELLKEILYIRVVQDTFCINQSHGDIEMKGWMVINKHSNGDTFKDENFVWASIERKDKQPIKIITDKF